MTATHFKARITFEALSGVGSTKMSRSPVARGSTYRFTAYAPTTMKRTLASNKARMMSRKSGFIGALHFPLLLAQLPSQENAFARRQLVQEFAIRVVRLLPCPVDLTGDVFPVLHFDWILSSLPMGVF